MQFASLSIFEQFAVRMPHASLRREFLRNVSVAKRSAGQRCRLHNRKFINNAYCYRSSDACASCKVWSNANCSTYDFRLTSTCPVIVCTLALVSLSYARSIPPPSFFSLWFLTLGRKCRATFGSRRKVSGDLPSALLENLEIIRFRVLSYCLKPALVFAAVDTSPTYT